MLERCAMIAAAACLTLTATAARAEFVDMYAAADDVGVSKIPRFGRTRVLVIPVEVKNAGLPSLHHEQLERFFMEKSEDELRFPSYWARSSNKRFLPEVTVAPTVYFEGCPDELMGQCAIARGDIAVLKQSMGMLRTVIDRANRGCFLATGACNDEAALDFTDFDASGLHGDSDGYLDGLMIVTNMPSVAVTLPAYAFNDGIDNLAHALGGPFIVDGVKVPTVALCSGREGAFDAGAQATCLQQFGHLLGLAELFQDPQWKTNHPTDRYVGLAASAMGSYQPVDGGLFLDAESRYRLGWVDVEVVSGTRTIALRPAAYFGGVVKLGVQQAERREYFLVEARGPIGPYDHAFRSTVDGSDVYGLAVHHVDWTQGPSGSFLRQMIQCLNCDPFHPFVMSVQADRRYEIQLGQPFAPESDLFLEGDELLDRDNTAPTTRANQLWGANWHDGTKSGISIRNVSVNPINGVVTFDVTAPEVEDTCADLTCGPGLHCSAGNCTFPKEIEEPELPRQTTKPAATTSSEGWGCVSVGSGQGFSSLAVMFALILGVVRRRRW